MHWVSFYSYKGGVGRTSCLWNVAGELAARGRTAIVIDFDFEAPGAHYWAFPNRPNDRLPARSVYELLSQYGVAARESTNWAGDPVFAPVKLRAAIESVLADAILEVDSVQIGGDALRGKIFLLPCYGRSQRYKNQRAIAIDWDALFAGVSAEDCVASRGASEQELMRLSGPGPLLLSIIRKVVERHVYGQVEQYADATHDQHTDHELAFLKTAYALVDMRTGRTVSSAVVPALVAQAVIACTSHHAQSRDGIRAFAEDLPVSSIDALFTLSPHLKDDDSSTSDATGLNVDSPFLIPFDRRVALGEAFVFRSSTGAGPAYRRLAERIVHTNSAESPFLNAAIEDAADVLLEVVYQRQDHIQELLQRLNTLDAPDAIIKHVILFGGIATDLKVPDVYARWLAATPSGHLFICHEGAESTQSRVLDAQSIRPDRLGTELAIRFENKRREVRNLRDSIRNSLPEDAATRVHFIQLALPLTQYLMIADDDIYLSPLFERRSSETASLKLRRGTGSGLRTQLYGFMRFHLTRDGDPEAEKLLTYLDTISIAEPRGPHV